jgi:hypothetical protein
MTVAASPTHELHYAPPRSRHRRVARRFTALLIIAAVASTGVWWFPRLRANLVAFHWQEQCMRHSYAANTVAYQQDFGSSKPAIAITPLEWGRFASLFNSVPATGTIFVHEMRNSRGRRRLVALGATYPISAPMQLEGLDGVALVWRVIEPGSPLQPPRLANTNIHNIVRAKRSGTISLYGGSLDPASPSHFTFVFECAEGPQTFDAWLRDDDSLVIEAQPARTITPPAPASGASLRTSGGSGPGPSGRRAWR